MYYFNPLTNASSWVKPEGFTGGVSEAVPTSQLRVPGTAWFEIHCEDGRKYYHNDKTEVRPGSWKKSRFSVSQCLIRIATNINSISSFFLQILSILPF